MTGTRMGRATPLAEITEKAWDQQLFASRKGLAPTLGWTLSYHTLRSKGSTSGFPDRVLVRERVIFAELKTETGKPTDAQQEWLTALARAGAETYLWRPSDLDEIAHVLTHRSTAQLFAVPPYALIGANQMWTPRSLWLPGGYRNDAAEQQQLVA